MGGSAGASGNLDTQGVIQAGSGNEAITLATGKIDADAIELITADGDGGISSASGMETDTDRVGLIQGCADGEVLKWNNGANEWGCQPDLDGATTWDSIANPAGSGAIGMAQTVQTLDWDTATDDNLNAFAL